MGWGGPRKGSRPDRGAAPDEPPAHNRAMRVLGFVAVVVGVGLSSVQSAPAPWSGKVLSVRDGDTLRVERAGSPVVVRLAGVDAPELAQAYGRESASWLRSRVVGRVCDIVPSGRPDRYGRIVAWVRLSPADAGRMPGAAPLDLSTAAVGQGCAWWYQSYAPRASELRDAQESAQSGRLGLWSLASPVPPWVWRARRR